MGITHRNISLDSLVCNEEGTFKISRLWNASVGKVTVNNSNRDSVRENIELYTQQLYRAPEQLTLSPSNVIGSKIDIFALGVVVYVLMFKKFPYESKSLVQSKTYETPLTPKYTQLLLSLVDKCLTVNPEQRPSAEELLSLFVVKHRHRVSSFSSNKMLSPHCEEL